MKPTLIILMGSIGSGKSTLARTLVDQGYLCLCEDYLRDMLGAGKYIYDTELENTFVHPANLYLLSSLLDTSRNIVLDETMLTARYRKPVIHLAKQLGYQVTGIVTPTWGKRIEVSRRMKSNSRGYTRKIWEQVWDKHHKSWEPPTKDEGFDLLINLRSVNAKSNQ